MKTKLDKEIKNQLNQREIQPSAAAWEKLNQMLDEEKPVAGRKRKFWLSFSVAASLILLATLLLILNRNTNPISPDEMPQIVSNHSNNETETNPNTEVQEPEILVATKEETHSQTVIQQETKSNQTEPAETEIQKPEIIVSNYPSENKEIKTNETAETETVIAFQKDSIKNQKKPKNFVDPEMLLYSVENNPAVHQENSDSKLVIIDFNKTK